MQRTALCRIAPAQLGLELRDARGLRRGHTAQLRERLRAVGCTQPYTERTTAQRSMRVLLHCSAHRSDRMPRTTRRANREGPAQTHRTQPRDMRRVSSWPWQAATAAYDREAGWCDAAVPNS
jgi:hypothetical protein